MNIHGPGSIDRAEELDPARAVDEVEEDELPHLPPREHAAGEPARLVAFDAGPEGLGLGSDGGDLVAVGKTLRRSQPRV